MPVRFAVVALFLASVPWVPRASTRVEVGNLTAQFPAGLRHERIQQNGTHLNAATDGVSRFVSVGVVEGAPLQCASEEARELGLRPGKTAAGFALCMVSKTAAEGDASGTMVLVLVQTIAGTAVVTSVSTDELVAQRLAREVADSVRVSERFNRRLAEGRDRRMVGCFSRYGHADSRSSSSTTQCFRSDGTYWNRTQASFANWRGESRGALMSRSTVADGVWSVRDGWLETIAVDGGSSRERIQFGERGFFLNPAPPGVEDDPDEEYWAKVEDGDVAPEPGEAEFEAVGWFEGGED